MSYPQFYHHPLLYLLLVLSTTTHRRTTAAPSGGGRWQLLQRSIGISAMHMQLLSNDRVIIFDRTDFGPSNLSLRTGRCRHDPNDEALQTDCTAHSAHYDPLTNSFGPLDVQTDTWCSSGSVLSDGRLLQTGGFNDGQLVVRTIQPCPTCDWVELPNRLAVSRWYATDHILPDGQVIIVGGRRTFSYEFFPKIPPARNFYTLQFLLQTNDPQEENNLYPFIFLNVDGNLFIFANNRAVLFNYTKNDVVRAYPEIPGSDPRCYPSTGSGVLLPIRDLEGPNLVGEVLICGGAKKGSYLKALNEGRFLPALNTCARMRITDPNPIWVIETMPIRRVMGDMILLPNGDVLIINGAKSGTAGWELGRDPILNPVLYHTNRARGSRFEVQNPTRIPRMYHSSAVLLRDGRVLVGGGNPHRFYNFSNVLFPTDLSLEAFSPPYLDPTWSGIRPVINAPASSSTNARYGKILKLKFSITGSVDLVSIKVTMIRPPFTTHSFSMSQRLLELTNATTPVKTAGRPVYELKVKMPGSANIAPPGFYMLFVVHKCVPSQGIWVRLQ